MSGEMEYLFFKPAPVITDNNICLTSPQMQYDVNHIHLYLIVLA